MPDREKVISTLEEIKTQTAEIGLGSAVITHKFIDKILALLKEQEVKTGYWIDSAGNDKCSICGEEYSDLFPDYGNTHFCPNCGAKMEGR